MLSRHYELGIHDSRHSELGIHESRTRHSGTRHNVTEPCKEGKAPKP